MDRRTFIASTATAGLAGLAGCALATGKVPPPRVPEEQLDAGGWTLRDETHQTVFEQSYPGNVTVTATAHTLAYEDEALRADVNRKTLDQVDGQFSMFSASRINFDPNLDNLPGGVGRKEILDRAEHNARKEFERQMKDVGLQNVSLSDAGTIEVATGEEATLTTVTAEFVFDDMTFPVTDERSITVEGEPVAVAGDLAVWHHGDFVLVAGGAYPGENFEKHIQEQVSDAITVSVDVDMGLTPDAYRKEVRDLITQVR